ncbi:hypothetical protein QTN25_005857 [Entamoeba marina]
MFLFVLINALFVYSYDDGCTKKFVVCDSGYYSGDDDQCHPCSDFGPCSSNCDSSDGCYNCESGYYKLSGYCYPSNDTVACDTCYYDLYGSDDKNGKVSYITCLDGYYRSWVNDVGTSTECTSSLHCETCSSSSTCDSCQDGYYLSSSQCYQCSSALSNCLECSNSETCTSCEDGYYINNDKCVKCSDTFKYICNKCTSSGCTSCSDNNATLLNNYCVECSDKWTGLGTGAEPYLTSSELENYHACVYDIAYLCDSAYGTFLYGSEEGQALSKVNKNINDGTFSWNNVVEISILQWFEFTNITIPQSVTKLESELLKETQVKIKYRGESLDVPDH